MHLGHNWAINSVQRSSRQIHTQPYCISVMLHVLVHSYTGRKNRLKQKPPSLFIMSLVSLKPHAHPPLCVFECLGLTDRRTLPSLYHTNRAAADRCSNTLNYFYLCLLRSLKALKLICSSGTMLPTGPGVKRYVNTQHIILATNYSCP